MLRVFAEHFASDALAALEDDGLGRAAAKATAAKIAVVTNNSHTDLRKAKRGLFLSRLLGGIVRKGCGKTRLALSNKNRDRGIKGSRDQEMNGDRSSFGGPALGR